MKRAMLAAVAVGSMLAFEASAQATMKSVAGTYVPVTVPGFGEKPRGLLMLGADGRYSVMLARATLAKIASGARTKATAEEYKMMGDGSIAHFGKWTIDDGGKTLTFHVDTSSFPNWDGTSQKRPMKLSGDTLVYTVPAPSMGGAPSELTWRRVK